MGLKDFYFALEDKYYAVVEKLGNAGIPLYKLVDALESKGIRTFPIFVIAIIAIILAAVFVVYPMFFAPATVIVVTDITTEDAIENANVTVQIEGVDDALTFETNAQGKTSAFIVPPDRKITVMVVKVGYDSVTGRVFSAPVKMEEKIEMNPESREYSLTVSVLNNNGTAFSNGAIRFSCGSNNQYDETETPENGVISLIVPEDCGVLTAAPAGNFGIENGTITEIHLEEGSVTLRLLGDDVPEGQVIVFVADTAEDVISGINVQLHDADSGIMERSGYSSGAGSFIFDDVAVGSYYITASGVNYEFYSSDTVNDTKTLNSGETIEFNVELLAATAEELVITVTDNETGDAIENAEVTLKKNSDVVFREFTENGEAVFEADATETYAVEVDAAGYILANLTGITTSMSPVEVVLVTATADNSQALNVLVVDSLNRPIDNVDLVLKKTNGDAVGDVLVTGIDGRAEFRNLTPGTYYVYGEKTGFEGKNSGTVEVRARESADVKITLDIGFGDFEVTVLDTGVQPMAQAEVTMRNLFTGAELDSGFTGADGKKTFKVRADQVVYFEVSAGGLANYYSVPFRSTKGAEDTVSFAMQSPASKLEVEFLGLELLGEDAGSSLGAGEKYVAKFQLKVPRDSTFKEAGIHVRTGADMAEKTNTMEEDISFIRGIGAATPIITRGTSYTPYSGYATDAKNITTGDAKWANIVWINPAEGIYNAEVEVQVKSSSALGDLVNITYRGWGAAGTYVRDPYDARLEFNETAGGRQALYANALKASYSVGPTNLCDGSFCRSFYMEDVQKGLRTAIVDEYNAKMSREYKLIFTISSISERTFADALLEITSDSEGLRFGSYSVTDAFGNQVEGTADGYNIDVPVGNLRKDSVVFGSVNFTTQKEGASILGLKLKSAGEVVFSHEGIVDVQASKEMAIEILPKTIVPFIDNMLLIKVVDAEGKELREAIVDIEINGDVIASEETNNDGVVSYLLQAPSSGTLTLTARKPDYKTVVRDVAISEDILNTTPPEIEERLSPTGTTEADVEVFLENVTAIPLSIIEFEITGKFKDLVVFELEEDYSGEYIDADSNKQVFFTVELSPTGMMVDRPVTLDGEFLIYVENTDFQRKWVSSVPLQVRISLGDSVDDSDCLLVDPAEWNVTTGGDKETTSITLINECAVDGEQIPLRNLEVKIADWETKVGSFTVSSVELDSSQLELRNSFGTFAASIPAGFDGTIDVEFTPSPTVSSASAEPEIIFRAANATKKGDETIKAKLIADVSIANIKDCVIVKETELTVITAPSNLGYNNYNSYNYNPNTFGGGWGSGPTRSQGGIFSGAPEISGGVLKFDAPSTALLQAGYNSGYPYSGGNYNYNSFPSNGYAPGLWNQYQQQGYGDQFAFSDGRSKFTVENRCKVDVEIDLGVPAEINAGKTQFVVEAGEKEEVMVESGYRMGRYELEVNGRIAESEESPALIETVVVIVRYFEDLFDPNACISLSKNRFRINFTADPWKLDIYNKCFDIGVRLPQGFGNEVVRFVCNTFSGVGAVPNVSGIGGLGTPSTIGGQVPYGISGQGCELVHDVIFVNDVKRSAPGGQTMQVVSVEVLPNIVYRVNEQFGTVQQGGGWSQLGGIRAMLSQGGGLSADTPAYALVNYYHQGGQDTSVHSVVITDYWNMQFPFPYGVEGPWDGPRCGDNIVQAEYETCDPPEPGVCSDTCQLIIQPGQQTPAIPGQPVCGNGIPEAGEECDMPMMPEMCTDKCKWVNQPADGETAECGNGVVEEDEECDMPGMPEMCTEDCKEVKKDEGDDAPGDEPGTGPDGEPTGVEIKACGENDDYMTGADVYEKYGFDRLLFDWQEGTFTGGNRNACDKAEGNDYISTEGSFCDGAQFNLTLSEKTARIEAFVAEHAGLLSELDEEYRNTREMYRAIKQTVEVTDDANTEKTKYKFFIAAKDERILDNGDLDEEESAAFKAVKDLIGERAEINNPNALIVQMETLLDEISVKDYSKNIVAEIENMDEWSEVLSDLGITEKVPAGHYVMTFREYWRLHNKLAIAMQNKEMIEGITAKFSGSDDLEIIDIDGTAITITVEFLRDLYKNIEFKVGIISNGLTPEEKLKVIEEGLDAEGVTNFAEFYFTNIKFSSYLIKDAFTTTEGGFVDDFNEKYTENTIGWRFVNGEDTGRIISEELSDLPLGLYPLVEYEAGGYTVFVYHDWSAEEAKTRIEINKPRDETLADYGEKYAENVFFQLPFDGKLGEKQNGGTRNGYGVGFTSFENGGAGDITLNSYPDGKFATVADADMTALVPFGRAMFRNDFDSTKNGRLLQIKTGDLDLFIYSPSNRVEMTMDGGGNAVFYDVYQEGEPVYFTPYAFIWKNSAGTNFLDSMESMNDVCPTGEEDAFKITNSGGKELKAFTFPPAFKAYELRLHCAETETTATTEQHNGTKNSNTYEAAKTVQTTVVRLSDSSTREYYNIKKYIDLINTEEVCINKDASENNVVMVWSEGDAAAAEADESADATADETPVEEDEETEPVEDEPEECPTKDKVDGYPADKGPPCCEGSDTYEDKICPPTSPSGRSYMCMGADVDQYGDGIGFCCDVCAG